MDVNFILCNYNEETSRCRSARGRRGEVRESTGWADKEQSEQDSGPLFFFGKDRANGFLSQHFPCKFTDEDLGMSFTCGEQYMMVRKALLFQDQKAADAILACSKPGAMKALGRKVQHFSEEVWEKNRYDIVRRGNLLKFTQNENLKKSLLETGTRELVEASPFDKVWGIGMTADRAEGTKRIRWGQNLLGKALMDVRQEIRKHFVP
jgi:ribA/ribD-fused uncharacterized protein